MQLSNGRKVDRDTPILAGSNFSWGEATKGLKRIPQDLFLNNKLICSSQEIEQNIIKLAKYLDNVRDILGNRPLIVTSWYRPKHINSRVGGSTNSQHLYGHAVDFYCNYLSPSEIYGRLDGWHGTKGGLAKYFTWAFIGEMVQ